CIAPTRRQEHREWVWVVSHSVLLFWFYPCFATCRNYALGISGLQALWRDSDLERFVCKRKSKGYKARLA
ncbi:MAG TPA: hypothetical protein PLW35_12655, partial [Verrucomicrobiota bacterium]|nr:hypothetical protein [Verrucomicrobiota bacterium]